MTRTLLAEDYKLAPTALRETPDLEQMADIGARPARRRVAELSSEPAAIAQTGTSAATEARSWRLLCAKFVESLKGCAEAYATAAAYENLSRLSDAELRRRSLSRDVLARDLMQ